MPATILVVDDEPSILRLVAAALETHGYNVLLADNGVEAITLCERRKPDLVLLDIMMPHMDGNEVRRRLKSQDATKDIPIVHLSAVGDFSQQLEALDEGTIDYITKPFAPSELREKVAGYLDPSKRDKTQFEHDRKTGQTRTIVEIMRRKSEE